jgi:excisionase family DNA binding protein
MPKEYGGEIYLTLKEAVSYLGVSRRTFYNGAKKTLTQHRFGGLARPYYKQSDVEALKRPHPVEQKQEE